jgi:hypothetical protein
VVGIGVSSSLVPMKIHKIRLVPTRICINGNFCSSSLVPTNICNSKLVPMKNYKEKFLWFSLEMVSM